MVAKVWFITGTSRGFGREWAIAALERGDKVAATADTASLRDLADILESPGPSGWSFGGRAAESSLAGAAPSARRAASSASASRITAKAAR
jgi:NAD(P)-dependent dehydrogenase (short-subunit alcohol dehydrogenase family)